MEINPKSAITALSLSSGTSLLQLEKSDNSFASHLNEQMAKAGKDMEDGQSNIFANDLAAIKEKGLSAYVRDLEKEKIEKIRKEILERMGLTEGDLAKLPPGQRAMIENMIAQEIKVRLLASSMKNNDDSDNKDQSIKKVMAGISPGPAFVSVIKDQEKNDTFPAFQKEENGQ